MNNLSSEFIDSLAERVDHADCYGGKTWFDCHEGAVIVESLRELLALREAGKELDGILTNEGTMFKPVADLFAFKAPGSRWWSFTEDAESIPEMVRLGWPVREYVTLERFQQAYASPQLTAAINHQSTILDSNSAGSGDEIKQPSSIPPGEIDYKALMRQIAEIAHGGPVDIGLLPVTVRSMQQPCAQQNQQQNIPEIIPAGWVMVPKEPTYQMSEAIGLPWEQPPFPLRWKRMLEAAPKADTSNSMRSICFRYTGSGDYYGWDFLDAEGNSVNVDTENLFILG